MKSLNYLDNDKIYTFKLTTGEEIVARLSHVNQEDGYAVIENPILTMVSPQGLQMMPGLFSADLQHNVRLNTASWVFVAETREDVRNSWIEATTGIKPVTKKIITG
jgi:hypothetical protein